jgi:CPA1 family monovalent cation:H+ antiporter
VRPENALVLLLAIASAVALLARRFAVPYPIALVLTGVGLGAAGSFTPPALTRELLYTVFLPGLVFEAAFHLDTRVLRSVRATVLALAVPGVIVTVLVTGPLLAFLAGHLGVGGGFALPAAFVFAALIAATDPIAVIALFKTLGAPHRLAAAVEAESLINDGTAVLAFTVVLDMVGTGHSSLFAGASHFVASMLLGALIGAALGIGVSFAFAIVDDPLVEITLTSIAAYGAFALAERFGYSGIIATMVAGMICGNYGAVERMRPSTRVAVQSFWSYVAFALNSLVFLLLGFAARGPTLLRAWRLIVLAYVAVLAGRALLVYATIAIARRTREAMPWSWAAILTWGGMRGALSMVLAYGIASDLPGRDTVVAMTVGVVTLSIVLQGLTSAPLLRVLGLTSQQKAVPVSYERALALLRDSNRALAALEETAGGVDAETLARLRAECEREVERARAMLRDARAIAEDLQRVEARAARRAALEAERRTAMASFREGVIDQRSLDALLDELDERLADLRDGE